jgi:hypothetical protein
MGDQQFGSAGEYIGSFPADVQPILDAVPGAGRRQDDAGAG